MCFPVTIRTAEKTPLDSLIFVRLKIPRLIPKELIESVKGKTFTPEQFYDYQEGMVGSLYNHLFALVDEDKKIHGYLWAESNALDGSLFINTFSVSKLYWGKGEAIKKVTDFLDEFHKKIGATKVFWATTNERFFLKKGFSRSKISLLEYNSN